MYVTSYTCSYIEDLHVTCTVWNDEKLIHKQFEQKGTGLHARNKRLQEHILFLNYDWEISGTALLVMIFLLDLLCFFFF